MRRMALGFACLLAAAGNASAGLGGWTSNGPYGGLVSDIVVNPKAPATLYAATQNGLFKSTDSGSSWRKASSGLPNTVVNSLAIDPANPQVLYVAIERTIFKTLDGGGAWTAVYIAVAPAFVVVLAIDPSNSTTLYAGIGYAAGGVVKTTDGGSTWSSASAGLPGTGVFELTVDPSDPNTLYAATRDRVFKSADGGGSWAPADSGLPVTDILALAAAQEGGAVSVYVSVAAIAGVYKSTNGGGTWAPASSGLSGLSFDFLPLPGAIYAGGETGIFRSADGGASWSPTGAGLPFPPLVFALAGHAGAPQTLYAGARRGVFQTTDGGTSWTASNFGLRTIPVYAIAMDPTQPFIAYAGGPYGVFKTFDGAGSWSDSSAGLFVAPDITAIAVHPSNPSTLYAVTFQCCGLYKSVDAAANWQRTISVPGTALIVDPQTPSTLYIASPLAGAVYKSTDAGATADPASTGLPSGGFPVDLAIDPQSPATLYAAMSYGGYGPPGGVFKTTDGAGNWVAKNSGLTDSSAGVIVVDPVRPETVYVSTEGGLFRSDDGADHWMSIQNMLPADRVTEIAVDPRNNATVYVGTFGRGVYRSPDRGSSWAPLNAGLDDLRVNSIAISPSGKTLYAGTISGVFSYLIPGASLFTLAPCRAVDTRGPDGPFAGPPLASGSERTFSLFGRCSIPATATAIAANITVTGASEVGHLIAYPAGSPLPPTSTINYRAGQTRANNAILSLDAIGRFALWPSQVAGTVQVIVDVAGYFE